MNKFETMKETLRDCFEGCMEKWTAIEIATYTSRNVQDDLAMSLIWDRWTSEMDEEGYYTF